MKGNRVTRRRFLQVFAAGGGAAMLAACVPTPTAVPAEEQPTEAATAEPTAVAPQRPSRR
ncbi:MAG: twin-arginine translocation signal domain-containing protein [Anaerolineae bacterium]